MLLKGKKVLITGGERGIGRQTALSAAQEGADIPVSYTHLTLPTTSNV